MTVVADTSPFNYLIQIEAIRILPEKAKKEGLTLTQWIFKRLG
jgi:hypothetical protein